MVKDNSEFNRIMSTAGISGGEMVKCDSSPQCFRWHYVLNNPLDIKKVYQCSAAFTAVNGAPVQIIGSKFGHFALSVSRENQREFPRFMDCTATRRYGDMVLGIDGEHNTITRNIKDTRSILVAGSSGGGKSVTLNSMIASLAINSPSDRVRLLLIDLKKVEFSLWENLPHLCAPVVTDAYEAVECLKEIQIIIQNRYAQMMKEHKRSASFDELSAVVIFIDEYAELATSGAVSKKELDTIVSRIAATGRACNVFLVISTQHPINSIISNAIRVNLPSKIGLRTANAAQSVNIIGTKDCCDLLGKGDAIIALDGELPQRVQIPYINEEDIATIQ